MTVKDFCDSHKKGKHKKFKGSTDRKKFIKGLGIKLVKHPTTGVEMVPVHDATLMLTGHRKLVERTREEEHDDRSGAKDAFKQQQAEYSVQTNQKELWLAASGKGKVAGFHLGLWAMSHVL